MGLLTLLLTLFRSRWIFIQEATAVRLEHSVVSSALPTIWDHNTSSEASVELLVGLEAQREPILRTSLVLEP
ncbi:uncharacterized protein N7529_001051 [Penicillium soppii]|uniref:uncharacterized protein n=1 Tax=Penicillium soppii TaxID=69789 RepID=UPI002549BD9B|nr:uncharacterized protein N7529_001051 [Penicillium soppii]KAJ5882379.1 hypothetical protein N7529_001051 [Penicillium soppii]